MKASDVKSIKKLNNDIKFISLKQAFKDKIFVFLLIVGILARISWCVLFPTYPETDFMWYHTKAVEISEGKGFLNGVYPYYTGDPAHPTAFRTIGYPATLAAVYFFTGANILAGKLLNVFLALVSMLLLFCISRKYFNRGISLLATALYALSPLGIVYCGIIGSETLFAALLLVCAYFMLFRRNVFLLGLGIGYLSLVRPIGIYFVGVIALYLFMEKNIDLKRKLSQVVTVIILTLVVITPWLIRNYMVFGTPVFSTNGGYVLYVNNNPYASGSWNDPYKYPNSPFNKYSHDTWFDELGMHNEGKMLATQWIRDNPKSFLKMAAKRMINSYWSKLDDIMWGFTTGINTWHPLSSRAVKIESILYKPFYIFVLLGIGLTFVKFFKKRTNPLEVFILLMFIYFNAMMFLLEGNSRYVYPLHTFYSLIVAVLIYNLYKSYSQEVIYGKIKGSSSQDVA